MICSVIPKKLLLAVSLAVLIASPVMARKGQVLGKEDLINVLLSPRLGQWLVGPVARIARADEMQAYLSLTDDSAAEVFIQEFWQKRVDPDNPWPGRQVKDIFDRRAEAADRLFTEGTSLGRRTDRGEIFILFGEALEVGFVQDDGRGGKTVEVWAYDSESRVGLHGLPPREIYFFTKVDGLTVFTEAPRSLKSVQER